MTEPRSEQLVVIGAGPCGLSCGLQAVIDGLRVAVVEYGDPGGSASRTMRLENLPGESWRQEGYRWGLSTARRFEDYGGHYIGGRVTNIVDYPAASRRLPDRFLVTIQTATIERTLVTDTVAICTGTNKRQLTCPGASLPGVEYMIRNPRDLGQRVVVVGSGNGAGQAALYAADHDRDVTLVMRDDIVMSARVEQQVLTNERIEIVRKAEVFRCHGRDRIQSVDIKLDGGNINEVCDNLLVFIGGEPDTDWLPEDIDLDETGRVVVDMDLNTSISGIFAGGDVRSGSIPRVITAAGDGVRIAATAYKYLEENKGWLGRKQRHVGSKRTSPRTLGRVR